jgi:hypothetical protein
MNQHDVEVGEFDYGQGGDGAARRGGIIGHAQRGWRVWKRVARRAGNLQARGIFNVAFFVLIAPISVAARLFNRSGDSAIRHRSGGWQSHPAADDDPMTASRRQF